MATESKPLGERILDRMKDGPLRGPLYACTKIILAVLAALVLLINVKHSVYPRHPGEQTQKSPSATNLTIVNNILSSQSNPAPPISGMPEKRPDVTIGTGSAKNPPRPSTDRRALDVSSGTNVPPPSRASDPALAAQIAASQYNSSSDTSHSQEPLQTNGNANTHTAANAVGDISVYSETDDGEIARMFAQALRERLGTLRSFSNDTEHIEVFFDEDGSRREENRIFGSWRVTFFGKHPCSVSSPMHWYGVGGLGSLDDAKADVVADGLKSLLPLLERSAQTVAPGC